MHVGTVPSPPSNQTPPRNANVNSMILKSLPDFGKLFRIVEFTFAFTALCFDCAGAAFMSLLPPSSLAMQQACSTEAPHRNSLAARGSTAVQQGCDASIKNRGLKCNPYLGQKKTGNANAGVNTKRSHCKPGLKRKLDWPMHLQREAVDA